MSNYIQNPRTSCALSGALGVVSALNRTIPILHAGPGCGLQASIGVTARYVGGGTGCPSTNMFEREVVFGGVDRLRETIQGSIEVMDGDLYTVLTGCTSGIIGDDVESVVQEFKEKGIPITYIETAGFKGDSYYGYEAAITALVKQFAEKTEREKNTVNLFGIIPTHDIVWEGNLEEITRILNRLGLKVNTFFTQYQGVNEIKKSSGAALNIILSTWLLEEVSEFYKDKFDVNSFRYPGLPIGPTATSDFIRKLAEKISIDKDLVEKVIKEEEDYVYNYFQDISGMVTRERYIAVGDASNVLGINRFLVNDYSQIPLVSIITDNVPESHKEDIVKEIESLEYARKPKVIFENDKWKISEIIREYKDEATMILGSSFEREIANELDIFFVIATTPSTETLILNKAHAGYKGCLTFIEDLYNNY